MGLPFFIAARVPSAIFLVLGVSLPSAAFEQQACSYDESSKTSTVSAIDGRPPFVLLSVDRGRIMYQEFLGSGDKGPVQQCGTATTTNTDLIQIDGESGVSVGLDLRGGPFAPGASTESSGSPEIELDFPTTDVVEIIGPAAGGTFRLGSLGANLNGDDDMDMAIHAYPFKIVYQGGPNADDIAATGGLGTGDPAPFGFDVFAGGGDDLVAAGNEFSTLIGHGGNDVLIGGTLPDGIWGSGGKDRIAGGDGDDYLEGGGGNDRIGGGAGDDRVLGGKDRDRCAGGTGKDLVEDCER